MTPAAPSDHLIWDTCVPYPGLHELAFPDRITHRVLHRSGQDYAFLHESVLHASDGEVLVAWNNSPRAESEPGTIVRWMRSIDPSTRWEGPFTLTPPMEGDTCVWESCQLLTHAGTRWAFVGQVHPQPRTPGQTGGRMVVFRWDEVSARWITQTVIHGIHPLSAPQKNGSGSWVMGGQYDQSIPRVAISHGTDFTQWDVVTLPSEPEDELNYAETALLVEGRRVTAFVRSSQPWVYTARSIDGGRTWTRLLRSNLPASSSKFCAGFLSTGQRYLAYNYWPEAGEAGERDTLVLAVSAPNERLFSKLFLIRKGRSPGPRTAGYAKQPQWSYPSVLEHQGYVYVSYSVTKEDLGLSMCPVSALSAGTD